jgi:integrase
MNIGNWKESTKTEMKGVKNKINDILGNIYIDELTVEAMRTYNDLIFRYPVNRLKVKAVRDLSLQEIFDRNINYKKISNGTAKDHIGRVFTFSEWCVDNNYLTHNPVVRLKGKGKNKTETSAIEQRLPWTDPELKHIFSQKTFTDQKRYRENYYWLPLIGLYTGARIEEICQLKLHDIVTYENTLCFDITNIDDDQDLKNEQSRRMIPIHQELIEFGLLNYITWRRSNNEELLLDGLKLLNGKYSKKPSERFSEQMKKIGFPRDGSKVFHSFRHTMQKKLEELHFEDYLIKCVLGHIIDNESHGRYGQRNKAVTIKNIFEKLSFKHLLSDTLKWQPPAPKR